MKGNSEYVELRSEEVQEILGTPPSWLVRWGTSVIVISFLAMLGTALLVRYPDTINVRVILSPEVPPVEVLAKNTGRIARLIARDRVNVRQGDLLAVFESSANYRDILRIDTLAAAMLKASVDAFRTLEPPRNLDLGEIQTEYSQFLEELELFQFNTTTKSNESVGNNDATRNIISRLEQSIAFDQLAASAKSDQLQQGRNHLANRRTLLREGLITQADYDRDANLVSEIEREKGMHEDNVRRTKNEITELRRRISNTSIADQEIETEAYSRLRTALANLNSAADRWKSAHLIHAPVSGTVSLNASVFTDLQYIKQGEILLSIIQPSKEQLIGRASLPATGSGKVEETQRVIIRLDGYPYHEFGTLEGKIISKSLTPNKDGEYLVTIILPNGLVTNTRKTIPYAQQLQGRAEIVTREKGFLERLLEPVFSI